MSSSVCHSHLTPKLWNVAKWFQSGSGESSKWVDIMGNINGEV